MAKKAVPYLNGTLGLYRHMKVSIEIEPGIKPVHKHEYAFPKVYMDTFKR